MIKVKCFKCHKELTVEGGLIFSPPYFDNIGLLVTRKLHVCKDCFANLTESMDETKVITGKDMLDYYEKHGITKEDLIFLIGFYTAKHPEDKIISQIAQYWIIKYQGEYYGHYLKEEPKYTKNKNEAIN